eukprot:8464704-Pyramimonas_sp.AAC.1
MSKRRTKRMRNRGAKANINAATYVRTHVAAGLCHERLDAAIARVAELLRPPCFQPSRKPESMRIWLASWSAGSPPNATRNSVPKTWGSRPEQRSLDPPKTNKIPPPPPPERANCSGPTIRLH